jgi:FkbM family methyltransferase
LYIPRSNTVAGKLLRLPLMLLPKGLVVPILSGPARGKKWIASSGDHSFWLGFYERSEINHFTEVVKTLPKGAVIFDFGAHSGYFSVVASSVNPDVVIHAFEPSFRAEFLSKHLKLNSIKNIHLHRCAVGKEETEVRFDGWSVVPDNSLPNSDLQKTTFIKQVSIDKEIQKGHLPYPDLIKMDIEGAEGDALLGMKESITKSKPKMFLSLHTEKLQSDCLKLLKEIGYQYKRIDEGVFFQVYAWV